MPFGLIVGAQLSNTLVPWGVPLTSLTEYGAPTVKQMKNSRHFTWPNVAFLGLDGDAKACLMHTGPSSPHAARDAYHLYLPDFHSISLHVASEPDTPVEAQLRSAFAHIKSHFGPATFCYPDYTKSLPSFFWELDDFFLSCSLQYGGTIASVRVRHYTAEHRAELATFDPPNRGARSDFVKWNDLW